MSPPVYSAYQNAVLLALPAIHVAEKAGAKCARHFAIFLNAANVASPTGKNWNDWGYLKARRYLHALDRTSPPRDYQAARDNKIGHDKRRVAMNAKMKAAGEAFAMQPAGDNEVISPLLKLKSLE